MDRRTVKTKKAICEAFLALLKQKEINKITVAELSRRADIGRGTFYLHYKDVYDLYDRIESELCYTFEELFDQVCPSTNLNSLKILTDTITDYIDKNRELFLLLISQKNCGGILHKIKTMLNGKVLIVGYEVDNSASTLLESRFCVAGVIGVIEEWLYHKLDIPQQEVSATLHQLLIRFCSENKIIQ